MSSASAPPCLVCGAPVSMLWTTARDVEYMTTRDTFSYWLCERCDALVIDPVPRTRLSEIYPSTYYSFAAGSNALDLDRNLVTRTKAALDRRAFRKILQEVHTSEPRILDVGGGTGDIAAQLIGASGRRARATVVDLDPESVCVARGRGLEGFAGRFEDFETDERFDVVVMLNLIEHVDDPISVLGKGGEYLTPKGVLWLQTPNWRSLDARLFRHRDWAGLHCPRHWVLFSRTGLERALSRAGLAPKKIAFTQAGAFWSASLLAQVHRARAEEQNVPLVQHRMFLPLAALGAAFDFATLPMRATSQQVCFAVRARRPSAKASGMTP